MVTGGYDGSKRLDSIEIYRVNVWTVSGQLPDATWVLKGITINNRVDFLHLLSEYYQKCLKNVVVKWKHTSFTYKIDFKDIKVLYN